jgi:Spy/CpxP family protein refolding chaperone
MTIHRATVAAGLFATGFALILPSMSSAAPPGGSDDGRSTCGPMTLAGHERHGFPAPPRPGRFFGMGEEWGAPPPFLAGLNLTEDQQDKLFSILYAVAPALREQSKALRNAHQALRELNTSAQFDESRAKALAENAAKADSQLMLLRARTEHDIYALLTPEQRKDLEERHHHRGHGEHDMPGAPQP